MNEVRKREDGLYKEKFGNIPDDQLGRIEFILGKKVNNVKFNEDIQRTAKKIKRIKKKTLEFTMYKTMKPSARPRANTRGSYIHMYVPRAAENGLWFEDFAKEHNLPKINTQCSVDTEVYQKTPSNFSIKEKVLAELGLLRPSVRSGDIDNFLKTILDMIQHGLLEDDCLVVSSSQELYYSIKPRCDVKITYWEKSPLDYIKEMK